MSLRLAVIGSGGIAPYHINSALKAGFKISCIAASNNSTTAFEIARDFKIPIYFNNVNDLLQSQNYDAIVVAIPPQKNIKILKDLINTGKPVLIEKPVALNSSDLYNFRMNKNLYVGYNRRFYESVRKLKELHLDSPGFFSFINPEIVQGSEISLNLIRKTIMMNTVHFLDMIRFFLGHFDLREPKFNKVNSLLAVRIFVGANYSGDLQITFNSKKNSEIRFENKNLNAIAKPVENLKLFNRFEIDEPILLNQIRRYVPSWNGDVDGYVIKESVSEKPGFSAMYQELFRIVNSGESSQVFSNLLDSFETLQKAEQIISFYEDVMN